MARFNADRDIAPTIDAYEVWAKQCLIGDGSVLSKASLWNASTIEEVQRAFVDHPDEGDDDFITKLKGQLKGTSASAQQLMAEMMWALLLFPSNIRPATKRQHIRDIWSLSEAELDEHQVLLSDGVLLGIGSGGPGFNNHRWRELTFLLSIATSMKQQSAADRSRILGDYDAFISWIESVPQTGHRQLRHMLRYFAFPDRVERMSSNGEREAILEGFGVAPRSETRRWSDRQLDDSLLSLRAKFESEYPDAHLDFYESPLREHWRDLEPDADEIPAKDAAAQPKGRVWIEKTHARGRKDREAGEYALGKMLWSPQRSKNGGDIYRFMRDVRPGDLVLHLTDNEGFTGRSVVAAAASEFNGLPGTDWADRPSYQIALVGFAKLTPPLMREVFFAPPFRERLVALIDEGQQNLFFNREPAFNQGAYLTPASEEVIAILVDAYRTISSEQLLPEITVPVERPRRPSVEPRADLPAIVGSFAEALRGAGLGFGERHDAIVRAFIASLATKRFVILTGLSGSGKSQIAIKFGQWLGKEQHLVVAVRPDWTGPDALFGYEDALRTTGDGRQAWHVPEVLEFLLSATKDPQQPFALVLDEMNLAHVERYFADALSGMESSEPCLPNLIKTVAAQWVQAPGPPKLPFPSNVFVIGTVNVDETTYLFSPKVLDRANTFEFRVRGDDLSPSAKKPIDVSVGDPSLVRGLLEIAEQDSWHLDNPPSWLEGYVGHLRVLHGLLSEGSLEFGHRVYYEAVRFAALHEKAGGAGLEAALDCQVLQKVLPRIHGSRKRVEATLCALGEFCLGLTYSEGSAHPGGRFTFDPGKVSPGSARLPMSFEKIQRMLWTLRANQFTSFTD